MQQSSVDGGRPDDAAVNQRSTTDERQEDGDAPDSSTSSDSVAGSGSGTASGSQGSDGGDNSGDVGDDRPGTISWREVELQPETCGAPIASGSALHDADEWLIFGESASRSGRRHSVIHTAAGFVRDGGEERKRREAISAAALLPPPPLVAGAIGGSGSRLVALLMLEAGCPMPWNRVNFALDVAAPVAFGDRAVRRHVEEVKSLAYDERAAVSTGLLQSVLAGELLFRSAARRQLALAEPSRAFEGFVIRDPSGRATGAVVPDGVCWGGKGAPELWRAAAWNATLPGGWSMIQILRDPRDLLLSNNRGQLVRYAASLLSEEIRVPSSVRQSRQILTAPEERWHSRLCGSADAPLGGLDGLGHDIASIGGSTELQQRQRWWLVLQHLATGKLPANESLALWVSDASQAETDSNSRAVRDARDVWATFRGQMHTWAALNKEARSWAQQRLRNAEDGSAPPFGYLAFKVEALATGSLRTFEGEVDDASVARARLRAMDMMGVRSPELVEAVDGDLLAWIAAGQPLMDGSRSTYVQWRRGETWEGQPHPPPSVRRYRPRQHGNARGTLAEEPAAADAKGLGGTGAELGRTIGGSRTGEEFRPEEHYGKWRVCAPGFIAWAESLVGPVMRQFGYTPLHDTAGVS